MAAEAEYQYVDVYRADEQGRPQAWKRISLEDLPKYQQEEASNYRVFASVQRYSGSVKKKGEPYLAPLFFDLDDKNAPENALEDAKKLTSFFTSELDCKPQDLQLFFSGNKGFHIIVSEDALGIEPGNETHLTQKHIAGYLKYRLDLKTMDLVVYTERRVLRLPNSMHESSRLFKTRLSIEELNTLSINEVRELARTPRNMPAEEAEGPPAQRPAAAHFWQDKLKEQKEAAVTSQKRLIKEVYTFDKERPPACVEDILEGGWKKDGDRNQATVQLACYFKAAGVTKKQAQDTLVEWVLKHTSATTGYQAQQREANTKSVIEAVYSRENEYHFGCAFIRSLHGEKKPGQKDYDRVKCAGDLCHVVAKDDSEIDPSLIHLSQTANAIYTGKLIKTNVMIAGTRSASYIVPSKLEYTCWGHKNCKKAFCGLHDIPSHTGGKTLGPRNPELIHMTGSSVDQVRAILREVSEIPSCKQFGTEVLEETNVDELLVIPLAEAGEGCDDLGGRYVLRKVYAIGGKQIEENRYYEITGYVYPHPKNQEGTIMVKSARPLQDAVESFKATPEVMEGLQVFRPQSCSINDINVKLTDVCNDLTYNVTRIIERDETLLAVLLTQHSALRLNVPWDTAPIRGWVECFILGDTGTGKSALVEKLFRHSGLGTRVNAESTSRTGLSYKMEQGGQGGAWYIVWGAWPLADKEIIWIDEATGITKEQYGEMTMARSEGKLEVKRAVTAETRCRVRAILSGNVPKGLRLADYSQGVLGLKEIFNNEDIRRFDFAVCMRMSDVQPDKYNKALGTYPVTINKELYKNSILYAWSRTADDIVWGEGAVQQILDSSVNMAKLYGNAHEVPLVTPADQRNKMARLAAALAILLKNTNEEGKIVVMPEHVVWIEAYLCSLYNSGGCLLNHLSRISVREDDMSEERYIKTVEMMKELRILKNKALFNEFCWLFYKNKYLSALDIEAMLNIDRDQAKAVCTMLAKNNLITKTSGGFRKTALFNAFLQRCHEAGMFDDKNE